MKLNKKFTISIEIWHILTGFAILFGIVHGLSRYLDYFIYSVQCPKTLDDDFVCKSTYPKPHSNSLYIIPSCLSHPFGIVVFTPQYMSLIFMMLLYIYCIYYVYKAQRMLFKSIRKIYNKTDDLETEYESSIESGTITV
jgi:hypothetical protein